MARKKKPLPTEPTVPIKDLKKRVRGKSPTRKNPKRDAKDVDASPLWLAPRKEAVIDYRMAYRFGHLHCTVEECAYAFNVNINVLLTDERFLHTFRRGWEAGKRGLRRLQWDQARKGNVQMQIWLGKQILLQSDQVTATLNETVTTIKPDLRGLSVEDLQNLRQLMEKAENTIVDVKAVEVEVKENGD